MAAGDFVKGCLNPKCIQLAGLFALKGYVHCSGLSLQGCGGLRPGRGSALETTIEFAFANASEVFANSTDRSDVVQGPQ